ncbi:MAG: hypothetical protein M1825_005971 [Sarcosagium campestre]|nr:MAG: hypothetical protein M1825_005971 [Sarcosagium campestre]
MTSRPPQSPSSQRARAPQAEQSSSSPLPKGVSQQTSRNEVHQSPSASPVESRPDALSRPSAQDTYRDHPDEPRTCWICFSDETEDTPLSSAWRTPCPCALTAHESCLLDWVAEVEAPGGRKKTSVGRKILCPQCKSEIVIARPRSRMLEAVSKIEDLSGKLIVPGVAAILLGCTYAGSWAYGKGVAKLVLGSEEMGRVLGTVSDNSPFITHSIWPFSGSLRSTSGTSDAWTWRSDVGMSLVPAVLILSRSSLADSVLPALPVLFLCLQKDSFDPKGYTVWPPSSTTSLAAIPYVRGAYNEVYEILFGKHERRWIKEVQSRSRNDGDGNGNGDEAGEGNPREVERPDQVDQDVLLELNVDIEVFEEDDQEGDNERRLEGPVARVEAPNAPPGQDPIRPEGQQAPAVQGVQGGQGGLAVSLGNVADSLLGALLFPVIAASMGGILRLTLPKSWTRAHSGAVAGKSSRILQTQWGRSIIGGCMFVVLKDAVVLYSRWKQAQVQRHRRVLDYDRKDRKARGIKR